MRAKRAIGLQKSRNISKILAALMSIVMLCLCLPVMPGAFMPSPLISVAVAQMENENESESDATPVATATEMPEASNVPETAEPEASTEPDPVTDSIIDPETDPEIDSIIDPEIESEIEPEIDPLEGWALLSENPKLALYYLDDGQIAVKDKRDGYIWYSNPVTEDEKARGIHRMTLQSQIAVSYLTEKLTALSAVSQAESVNQDGLTIQVQGEKLINTYNFPKIGIKIGIIYELKDDYMQVSVPTELIEYESTNKVYAIDVLPAFGAANINEDGYMLVPDGSGALIHFNNGITAMTEFSLQLYGIDAGVESTLTTMDPTGQDKSFKTLPERNVFSARMPVFGMSKSDGHGYFSIITQNDAKASIKARVSNLTNHNYVYSTFQVLTSGSMVMYRKEFDAKPQGVWERDGLTTGDYTLRYYFLKDEESTYGGMAETYREYLIDEMGLEKRVEEGNYPLYLDLSGYVKKQTHLLGIPYTKAYLLTTIKGIEEIADSIGVDQTIIRYNSWIANSTYEKIPNNINLQSGLGTHAELNALSKKLEATGGGLYPSIDMINIYKTGNGFRSIEDAVQTPVNSPQLQYQRVYGVAVTDPKVEPWYLLSPLKYQFFYQRFLDFYNKLDIKTIGLASIADICASDNRKNGMGRGDVPQTVRDTLQNYTNNGYALMLDGGNAYAASLATHLINSPEGSAGRYICDETVPFYQMVYHGYIYYGIGATNHTSSSDLWTLKCLEYGASPTYALVHQNIDEVLDSRMIWLISPDYTVWQETIKQQYAMLQSVLQNIAHEKITNHQNLTPKVARTDYETVSIYINYGDTDYTINNITVPARGYTVTEVGK